MQVVNDDYDKKEIHNDIFRSNEPLSNLINNLAISFDNGNITNINHFEGSKTYKEAVELIRDTSNYIKENKCPDIYSIKEVVSNLVCKEISSRTIYLHLKEIKNVDTYTFNHCVNVSIIAVAIGRHFGLNENELKDLAAGCLLHDIGKTRIPLEILLKPSKLSDDEFEIMKKHTTYGYEILSNTNGINGNIAQIALNHHEKYNGQGYPNGLNGRKIDKLSRICTIADIFEAMTTARVYKKAISTVETTLYLLDNSSKIVDPRIMRHFISSIDINHRSGKEISMSYSDGLIKQLYQCFVNVLSENEFTAASA